MLELLAQIALVLVGLKAAMFLVAVLRRVTYSGPGNMRKRYGEWAVVTGASDGIGKAYAAELARKGLKVMLVARTESKLQAVAEEIKSKVSGAEVDYIVLDFSDAPADWRERVAAEMEEKGCNDVGVLVNNVGISYSHAEYLHRVDQETIDNNIRINVEGTTAMTRLVVGDDESGMAGRKRGVVVNITSAAGVAQCGDPFYTVYSGSKAYISYFSRSLFHELKHKKVEVQCQVPWFVTTKLAKIRKSTMIPPVPTPEAWARCAVAHIGRTSAGPLVTPHVGHAIQAALIEALPESVAASFFLGHHIGVMKKAYKKKGKTFKL